MGYSALTDAEIAQDKFMTTTVMDKIQDNFAYLYAQGTNLILPINASFEIDEDADGIPDNWTRSLYPGGAGGLYTTSPAHGAKAAYFTHPGGAANGGGYLDGDYIEISQLQSLSLFYILWATAAGMKNEIRIRYYDKAKAYVSDVALYSSVTNPASATLYFSPFTPAATARYIKIRIIGGFTDTDVAGTAYFDGLWLVPTISLATMEHGSIALPFCMTEEETALHHTGDTAWTTQRTYRVYIPSNATSIKMAARIKNDGAHTSYVRFKVSTSYSEEGERYSTPYAWVYIVLDASALDGWYDLGIEIKTAAGATGAYLQGFTFIWE